MESILEFGRKVKSFDIPESGLVFLRPTPEKVGIRPKVLVGSNIRLFPIKNDLGKIVTNHTKEEYDEISDTVPSNFWDKFQITIPHKGKVYNVSKVRELLELRLLALYPIIAPDKDSITSQHLFYVENLQSDAIKHNQKTTLKFKAMSALYKMTNSQKIRFLALYEHSTNMVTPEIAESKLAYAIESNPEKFLSYLENEEKTTNEIDFSLAVQQGIIKISGQSGEYLYNKSSLGFSREEAFVFFTDIKNQKLKMAIKDDTEKKQNK